MNRLILIFVFVSNCISTYGQWVITTGPTEPNVTTLAANDYLLLAGCSSASTSLGGYLTLNNGNNWAPVALNLNSKFTALAISPSNGNIYAGGQNAFYQSYDSGSTWLNTNNGLSSYMTRDIIIDGSKIYASVQGVYLSTNGGINWSLISPVISSNKMDKVGNTFLVGTITAGIYLSINGGSSWTNYSIGLPSSINDVKIVGTSLLAATQFGTYVSVNGGVTWTLTNLTLPTECLYQIGTTLFAGCSNSGGVYFSTDGGNTWNASNSGLTNLTVYSLTSNSTYIFAGTTGSVFRRQLSDYGITTAVNMNGDIITDLKIAPNPSSGIFTITKSTAKKMDIVVYNINGESVFTTNINSLNTSINLSNLSKGIYFMKLVDSSENTKTYKILIQ